VADLLVASVVAAIDVFAVANDVVTANDGAAEATVMKLFIVGVVFELNVNCVDAPVEAINVELFGCDALITLVIVTKSLFGVGAELEPIPGNAFVDVMLVPRANVVLIAGAVLEFIEVKISKLVDRVVVGAEVACTDDNNVVGPTLVSFVEGILVVSIVV
jgi:hypothetical protein